MDKILVVQTAFLGDVILITPLIRGLKEIFPEARIDALIRPQNAAVLNNNPYIDKLLFFDKSKRRMREFFRVAKAIKTEKYTVAVTPHSSFTTALLLFLGGIKRRVGYNRYLARHFLTDKFPHRKNVHKTVKNLELLKAFSDESFDNATEIYPSAEDTLLADKAISNPNTIVFAPGSVWATKRWPAEYYASLAAMLKEKGYEVVFSGGAAEALLCDEIIAQSGCRLQNFAGKLSVTQSAAVFRACRLLISNDSGALHIANAVNTPVYAFFGPTVTTLGYYPYKEKDRVFEVDIACRPCGSHGGRACHMKHFDCMRKIEPQTVLDAVIANFPILGQRPQNK
ncbi:MAG: lipopolysaccharide heptosyltransferase II [Candidatus Cloacimonetes bacterium]|nr:lipopolysaccharide heptosyltransferase II [Candidatus Cloacimonadota bacterium]